MAPQPLDELGAADDDAGLRPAEQLVAREADEVGAVRDRSRPSARPVRPYAEATPEPRSSTSGSPRRAASRARSRSRGRSVKPITRKFDWCTRRMAPVSVADRALVVGDARPVGGADLDEPRARARQHVRDAEAVADLDQLAARHDHLAALGERGEREQHGRRVVVDDQRRLGAGQPPQERRAVVLPRAARAVGEVVLEVRVAARHLLARGSSAASASGARPRFVCRTTPRRVDHAPQPRARRGRELGQRALDEVAGLGAGRGSPRARARARPAPPSPRPRAEARRRSSRSSSSTDGRSRSLTRAGLHAAR